MMYLKDLGFEEDIVELLEANLPSNAIRSLKESKETVINNVNYLIELGITNYSDAFVKFYNMFLMENDKFEEIFSKYDREDLIAKLEKNVAIMEYL